MELVVCPICTSRLTSLQLSTRQGSHRAAGRTLDHTSLQKHDAIPAIILRLFCISSSSCAGLFPARSVNMAARRSFGYYKRSNWQYFRKDLGTNTYLFGDAYQDEKREAVIESLRHEGKYWGEYVCWLPIPRHIADWHPQSRWRIPRIREESDGNMASTWASRRFHGGWHDSDAMVHVPRRAASEESEATVCLWGYRCR